MVENSHYPDLEAPEGPMGNLKKVVRLPQMRSQAPAIRWGEEYESWPMEKRLRYAEKLASAMNHAADVLQQERNKLIELVRRQEEQIKALVLKNESQGELVHRELRSVDKEKQELYQQIVTLKALLKKQNRRIQELEGRLDDHD